MRSRGGWCFVDVGWSLAFGPGDTTSYRRSPTSGISGPVTIDGLRGDLCNWRWWWLSIYSIMVAMLTSAWLQPLEEARYSCCGFPQAWPAIRPRQNQKLILGLGYMASTTLIILLGYPSTTFSTYVPWATNPHTHCTTLSHHVDQVGRSNLGGCAPTLLQNAFHKR